MEANTKRRITEKELSYNLMDILGRGSYGSFVFVGEFGENKKLVAVKRFQWNYIKPDSIEKFKTTFVSSKLKDTNVLPYLAIEKGPDFLFIVTELCVGTLKHLVEGKYQGPPIGDIDERRILFQVTSGLNYLHSSNIIHRDIKPSNILIFFPPNEAAEIGNNEKVLFKLADFGIISTLITDERDFRKKKEYRPDASLSGARGKSPKNWKLRPVSCAPCDLAPGYKVPSEPPLAALKEYVDPHGTQGWIPPELYDSDTDDYDSKVDIFALGCVFGYTLSGGKHLFGDSPLEQAIRILHKKPMTLALADLKKPFCDDATIFELIESMVEMEPNDRPSSHAVLKNQFFLNRNTEFQALTIEEDPARRHIWGSAGVDLLFNFSDQIPSGNTRNALVFKGTFNGTVPIALKRYQMTANEDIKSIQRDLEFISLHLNKHPNIIRYLGHADDENFSYIALELCVCSVADIVDPKRCLKIRTKTPYFESILDNLSNKEILRQSSEGVSFLHECGFIHRNIHPDNFLIACVDPKKGAFLIKLTDFQLSSKKEVFFDTGTLDKEGWVSPESFSINDVLTYKSDAFMLGCYHFYVLSGGKHPFGRGVFDQRTRIKNKSDPVYQADWDGQPEWPITNDVQLNEQREEALKLIKDLIKFNPEDRKSVKETLFCHHFSVKLNVIYDNPAITKPGLFVMVTQEKYDSNMIDQKWDFCGFHNENVQKDAEKIVIMFRQSFGYDILSAKNLRSEQIKWLLSKNELVKRTTNVPIACYKSLIVCFLGHGSKGTVLGIDGNSVSLELIQHDSFNYRSFPDFGGKPKTFVVFTCQACKMKGQAGSLVPSIMPPTTSGASSSEFEPRIEECFQYFGCNESTFIQKLCDLLRNEYINRETMTPENSQKDVDELLVTSLDLSVCKPSYTLDQLVSRLSKSIQLSNETLIEGISFQEFDGEKNESHQKDTTNESSKLSPINEKLGYYKQKLLGKGFYGIVYLGQLNGQKMAVKRVQKTSDQQNSKILQEIEALKRVGEREHPNILRFVCIEQDEDFFFIVTELCHGTLWDWIKDEEQEGKYKKLISDEKTILMEVTKGLEYLHESQPIIVHRDINPNNILIFVPPNKIQQPRMKLADFGISRILLDSDTYSNGTFMYTSLTNPSGTGGYMAPEIFKKKPCDFKVDIFALGCVFGCTLSIGGKHPFGSDKSEQVVRIKKEPKDEPYMLLTLEELKESYTHDNSVFELIKSMVDDDPVKRPTTKELLDHSFFK